MTTDTKPTTWSGWALTDRPGLMAWLNRTGIVPAHEVLVADHVTLAWPATDLPAPVRVVVVGMAADDRVQALVVEVDGETVRPDGETYHVTLSRIPAARDMESKAMLQRTPVTPLGRLSLPTTPFLRPC